MKVALTAASSLATVKFLADASQLVTRCKGLAIHVALAKVVPPASFAAKANAFISSKKLHASIPSSSWTS